MKNFNIIKTDFFSKNKTFLVLFFITSFLFSQNQFRDHKNAITFGVNIVDDSFTTDNNPFNVLSNWNFKNPIYIGYTRNISRAFNLVGNFTYNEYKENKLVDGRNIERGAKYYAFDALVQYDLSSLSKNEKSKFFYYASPYVTAGLGYSSIADLGRLTFNYGFGINVWVFNFFKFENPSSFFKDVGVNFQTTGKSSFEPEVLGNQIQHLAGFIYRF